MATQAWSVWEPDVQLLTTRLTGEIHVADVARWAADLHTTLAQVEPQGSFLLLGDLSGYELRDMAAHKAMRGVIPQLLATYGVRAAVFDLFPEADVTLTRTRGIVCRGYANVHHDVDKMVEYERTLGRARQRFFVNAADARVWLLSLELDMALD